MNIEGFQQLVKLLDKISIDPLPGVEFDMGQWGGKNKKIF